MSRHLVFFFHSGPEVRSKYAAALAPIGEFDLVQIYLGGYSSSYSVEAERLKDKDGRVLPSLIARYGPNTNREPKSVSIIHFSAGYALARAAIRHPLDAAAVSCLVSIDSIHSSYTSGGAPNKMQLSSFAEFARLAKLGKCRFALGHTDVRTPKFGLPNSFASTTECAQAITEMVMGTGGGFTVDAFNTKTSDHDEHIAALVDWGAPFAADAIVPFLTGRPSLAPAKPAWLDASLPLGERAVLWSLNEMACGVKEDPPGSNTGPRIRWYLGPCIRRETGRLLGLTSGAWCAAACNAASMECLLPGEACPAYRASGLEMQDDAQQNGSWHSVADVRAGKWRPKRGDIAIYDRSHEGQAWMRHVVRLTRDVADDGAFESIAGNEGNQWRVTPRDLADSDLLGFIEAGGPVGQKRS